MKRERLLMLLGSICLALMLLVPLAASCGPATPEEAAEEIAALESRLAAEKAKVSGLQGDVSDLEDEIAALRKPEGPFHWKWQAAFGPGDYITSTSIPWKIAMIEEETDGGLIIDVFAGGEIFGREEVLMAMGEGLAELASTAMTSVAGVEPIADLGFGIPGTNRQPWGDAWALQNMSPLSELMREVFARHGCYFIGAHSEGPYPVHMGNVPIRKLEDWEGVKVRTTGMSAVLADKLGAATCYFPGAEMYEALMLGTVDVIAWSIDGVRDMSLYEVMDYLILPPFLDNIYQADIANEDAWASLPESYREAILHAERANNVAAMDFYWGEFDYCIEHADELGYEVVTLADEDIEELNRIIADVIWDDFAKKDATCAEGIKIVKHWYGMD